MPILTCSTFSHNLSAYFTIQIKFQLEQKDFITWMYNTPSSSIISKAKRKKKCFASSMICCYSSLYFAWMKLPPRLLNKRYLLTIVICIGLFLFSLCFVHDASDSVAISCIFIHIDFEHLLVHIECFESKIEREYSLWITNCDTFSLFVASFSINVISWLITRAYRLKWAISGNCILTWISQS